VSIGTVRVEYRSSGAAVLETRLGQDGALSTRIDVTGRAEFPEWSQLLGRAGFGVPYLRYLPHASSPAHRASQGAVGLAPVQVAARTDASHRVAVLQEEDSGAI